MGMDCLGIIIATKILWNGLLRYTGYYITTMGHLHRFTNIDNLNEYKYVLRILNIVFANITWK